MPIPENFTAVQIRTDAACRAFWSNHPLNLEMRKTRDEFTISEFIAFVVAMPADKFNACMFSAGVRR